MKKYTIVKPTKKIIFRGYLLIIISVFILLTLNIWGLKASSPDDCLMCHEDKDLTMEKNGKKISLYVNPSTYKNSVHGSSDCIDCHEGYIAEELPHNPKAKDVDCNGCHGIKVEQKNVHKNVKCYDCHSYHDVIKAKEFGEKTDCYSCHNTRSVTIYKNTAHFRRGIKCDACHNKGHEVIELSKSNGNSTCTKCHRQSQLEISNSVHRVQPGKQAPKCLDCHSGHNVSESSYTIETRACMKCHLNEKIFPGEDKGSSKYVGEYTKSVHALKKKDGKPAAGCSDCHGNHMIQSTKDPNVKTKILETCEKCHPEVVSKFRNSSHGRAFINKYPYGPSCSSCHGEHGINAVSSEDKFYGIKETEMCLDCHSENKLYTGNKEKFEHIREYNNSAHYLAFKEGKTNSASCSSCHGSHEMLPMIDVNSKISKKNQPMTCGTDNCHKVIKEEFTGSIHQVSIETKENPDAPTCTNCHGSHQILNKEQEGNITAKRTGVVKLCSDCHSSVEIIENNNLPKGITDNFNESFHGLALRGGSQEAADCGSCHGYHNIRPSSDPLSTIHKSNLPVTCGKCHPGAVEAVFNTPIHILNPAEDSPWLYYITVFYIILIVAIIGGMVLHNIIDFVKKIKHG